MALLAAVRLDHEATAAITVADSPGGLARFVAVGDSGGRIYLIRPTGEVQLDFQAGAPSPLSGTGLCIFCCLFSLQYT